MCAAARSSEQRAPFNKYVLKHVLVKHVPEYVLGHMVKHVLRHVPSGTCLSTRPSH